MSKGGKNEYRKIADMTDSEVFFALLSFFGPGRLASLMGIVAIASLSHALENRQDTARLVALLEEQGMTKSVTYRALLDLRRFIESTEGLPPAPHDHVRTMAFVSRLATLSPA